LKGYIEVFIADNQLIIGSQKSMKEILMYPRGIKKLKTNQDKDENG
jgi:hypothetical protein